MADKHYAVTRIKFRAKREEVGNRRKSAEYIEAGEEVSASKLDLDAQGFQELIDTGVVGTKKNDDGSVVPLSEPMAEAVATDPEDAKMAAKIRAEIDKANAASQKASADA